jgi:hypothetical protein
MEDSPFVSCPRSICFADTFCCDPVVIGKTIERCKAPRRPGFVMSRSQIVGSGGWSNNFYELKGDKAGSSPLLADLEQCSPP